MRYLLIPLMIVLSISLIFAAQNGGADGSVSIVREKPRMLARESLRLITPDLIHQEGLTIQGGLQKYIADMARRYRISFGTVAVMDAYSGDILALYGKDQAGEDDTLALDTYLAASVFKIVTATAAINNGMTPLSPVSFSGSPYTLYKGQLLAEGNKRGSQQITFAQAFAKSNNVVFGKVGSHFLGVDKIMLAALELGFWRAPVRDCWSAPSTVFIPENEYNLAELASGFNHATRISSVHGAQIASAIVNGGRLAAPRILKSTFIEHKGIMRAATAENLRFMMAETLNCGTFAARFRSCKYDGILGNLSLGAKSGSIDSKYPDPTGRLNWFVGYAEHPTRGAITIGCLLLRDRHALITAGDFARLIIKRYYLEPELLARKG